MGMGSKAGGLGRLKLDNLYGGALNELFNLAMRDVFANIADPNTDTKTARQVTITIKMKPSDDQREIASTEYYVDRKLARVRPIKSTFYVDFDGDGNAVGQEIYKGDNPNQLTMEQGGNVVPLKDTRVK